MRSANSAASFSVSSLRQSTLQVSSTPARRGGRPAGHGQRAVAKGRRKKAAWGRKRAHLELVHRIHDAVAYSDPARGRLQPRGTRPAAAGCCGRTAQQLSQVLRHHDHLVGPAEGQRIVLVGKLRGDVRPSGARARTQREHRVCVVRRRASCPSHAVGDTAHPDRRGG